MDALSCHNDSYICGLCDFCTCMLKDDNTYRGVPKPTLVVLDTRKRRLRLEVSNGKDYSHYQQKLRHAS